MLLLVLACAPACGSDPTLEIVVHHPTGSVIASTTITVYDSPTLTCDAVRFGDVDDTELAGLVVAQETLFANAPTQGNLDNIPRVDHKVIVGRGLDNDGSLATGGCIEQGEIDDSLTLTIDTVVAALASTATDPGSSLANPDLYGIDITVTDINGAPIGGREVSWRVYGAAGTQPAMAGTSPVGSAGNPEWDRSAPTCTGVDGLANLHPIPPNLTGGYEVRPRVAWTQQPVAAYSTLTHTGAFLLHGAVPATTTHPCAVGHLAGLDPPGVGACIDGSNVSTFHATVGSDGTVTATTDSSVALASIGLFSLPDANGSDVNISSVDGARIDSVVGNGPNGICLACKDFDDIQLVPSCGNAPAFLLGHSPTAPTIETSIIKIDLSSAPYTQSVFPINLGKIDDRTIGTIDFNAAGCMTLLDASGMSSPVQVVVLDFEGSTLLATTRPRSRARCTTARARAPASTSRSARPGPASPAPRPPR